jgi:hypothetical protein
VKSAIAPPIAQNVRTLGRICGVMTTSLTKSTRHLKQPNSQAPCSLCSGTLIPAPQTASGAALDGTQQSGRPVPGFKGAPVCDFELVGYETICGMLAVDGKAPSQRTVMRHLRRHRDIVKPVKIGAHVGYPVEQILKFIARLKGKEGRREMFL